MEKFTETDFKIIDQIAKAISLLGGKNDILGSICSWKDTLPDVEVLNGLESWNDWKRNELIERLELGRTINL